MPKKCALRAGGWLRSYDTMQTLYAAQAAKNPAQGPGLVFYLLRVSCHAESGAGIAQFRQA